MSASLVKLRVSYRLSSRHNEIKPMTLFLASYIGYSPSCILFMYLIFLIYHQPEKKMTHEAVNFLLIPNNSDYMDE